MSIVRKVLKKNLPPILIKLGAMVKRNLKGRYSFLDEETIIKKYLDLLPLSNNFCVDIAAADGINSSNTYFLYENGWSGIAVELDPINFSILSNLYIKFVGVNLVKTKVTPENVIFILKACECPNDFSFLNLDIDSYDHFVLEQILFEFRPSLICLEINESIPPPISFTVKYDIENFCEGHFFGQSISKCYELCQKFNYDIVELYYNNLFIVPHEINKQDALSPEDAYRNGYKGKIDRKEIFPWNKDMEIILNLSKDDGIKFLDTKFKKYKGKYIIE
jgi:hypothetical protein